MLDDGRSSAGAVALILCEVGSRQAEAGGVPRNPALRGDMAHDVALQQDTGGVGLPRPAEVRRIHGLAGDEIWGRIERTVLERQP